MIEDLEKDRASILSMEARGQLVYKSLEQFNNEQKRRKLPAITLAVLCILFLSSAGGIALAILLMLNPVEVQAACLSRDFIFFAAVMSIIYIGIHIRAALQDYTRTHSGPPHMYGNYLHASAIIVARFSIATWIGGLIATAFMISRAITWDGLASKLPILNLLICIGALPSLIIISCTIERHEIPFATTGLSQSSLLTCRASDFEVDLAVDEIGSRRASICRSTRASSSASSMASVEICQPLKAQTIEITHKTMADEDVNESARTSLMAKSPSQQAMHMGPLASHPTGSSPQPVYYPGGWRSEWSHVAEKVGRPVLTEGSDVSTNNTASTPSSPTCTAATSDHSRPPSVYSAFKKTRATPSTSIANSTCRSGLSTVRYASKPDLAVCAIVKVIPNQRRDSDCSLVNESGSDAASVADKLSMPKPVVLLRKAQRTQPTGHVGLGLQ